MALKEAVAKVQKLLDQERAKNDVLSREFKDTGSLNVVAKLRTAIITVCKHSAGVAILTTCVEFIYLRAKIDFFSLSLYPVFQLSNAAPIKFRKPDTSNCEIMTSRSRSKGLSTRNLGSLTREKSSTP